MTNMTEIENMQNNAVCLYSEQEVLAAIKKVAEEMNAVLRDSDPIFLCVMNGALIFMGQLATQLHFPLQINYVRTSRFRGAMEGGELNWLVEPELPLKDRTVVIVEDVLDTGTTLTAILDYCKRAGSKKVYTAALVDKAHPRGEGVIQELDFVGLHTEDKFLIGYGLDYQEYLRNLPGIYAVVS